MKIDFKVPFQTVLDFLSEYGFDIAGRIGSCVALRHPATKVVVTINARPGEALGRVLLMRLFFDLGIVGSDLRIREKEAKWVLESAGNEEGSLRDQIRQFEGKLLETAMRENRRNVARVAFLFGVSRPTMYEKLKAHNVSVD